MEFEVTANKHCLRLLNWDKFIEEKVVSNKNNDTVLLFVTFNQSKEACILLDHLVSNAKKNYDILVLDNASERIHWDALCEKAVGQNGINLIRTLDNLGGGGGYAVALEWAMSKGYDFILVTEDDAMAQQPDLVDRMVLSRDQSKIITVMYENAGMPSFTLHFTLYPYSIIQEAGVPDPRFFMIHDDLEYSKRHMLACDRIGVKYECIHELTYRHPTLKPKGKIWTEYFDIRNGLSLHITHGGLISYNISILSKLPYAYSRWLFDNDISSLNALLNGFSDFLFNRFGYEHNKIKLDKFRKIQPNVPLLSSNWHDVENIREMDYDVIFSGTLRRFIGVNHGYLAIVNKLIFNKITIISSSYLSFWHPLLMLANKVIFIEEISLDNKKGKIKIWNNNYRFRTLKFLFVVIMSIITSTIMFPFLNIKYISSKLLRLS
jgi:GT2 family glycosyltransferase